MSVLSRAVESYRSSVVTPLQPGTTVKFPNTMRDANKTRVPDANILLNPLVLTLTVWQCVDLVRVICPAGAH